MPYVAVLPSPTAVEKLKQNNLTPSEFLRPFGHVGNLNNISMKTSDKSEPYKLNNFRINFIELNLMQHDQEKTDKTIQAIFRHNVPA